MTDTREMPELKPCPFCNKTEPLYVISSYEDTSEEDDGNPESWAVVCDASSPPAKGGCGGSGGYALSIDEAVAKWNKQAPVVDDTPNMPESIAEQFRSVLCDPDGNVSITGSVGDRAIIQKLLARLASIEFSPIVPVVDDIERCAKLADEAAFLEANYANLIPDGAPSKIIHAQRSFVLRQLAKAIRALSRQPAQATSKLSELRGMAASDKSSEAIVEASREQWTARADPRDEEIASLRYMLAIAYSGSNLYGDDGELQDNRLPHMIDFKRDSTQEIRNKMEQRALDAYVATKPAQAESQDQRLAQQYAGNLRERMHVGEEAEYPLLQSIMALLERFADTAQAAFKEEVCQALGEHTDTPDERIIETILHLRSQVREPAQAACIPQFTTDGIHYKQAPIIELPQDVIDAFTDEQADAEPVAWMVTYREQGLGVLRCTTIASLEPCEPCHVDGIKRTLIKAEPLYAQPTDALRSARQEPIAWLELDHTGNALCAVIEKDPRSPFNWRPLYAHPYQPALESENAKLRSALEEVRVRKATDKRFEAVDQYGNVISWRESWPNPEHAHDHMIGFAEGYNAARAAGGSDGK